MTYTKQTWENSPLETTPISAERLAHMEDGIEAAHELVVASVDSLEATMLQPSDLGLVTAVDNGIVPDGTDQQLNIAVLLTFLASGGVIQFQDGTYRTAGNGLPSLSEYRGVSRDLTVLKATSGATFPVIHPDSKTSVVIRDMGVDGNYDVNGGSASAVRFDSCIDARALFGRSLNAGGYGIGFQDDGVQRALVLGWHLEDIGSDGIDLKNDAETNWGNTFLALTADGWALNNGGVTKAMLDLRGPGLAGFLWGRNPDPDWGVGMRFHITEDTGGNGDGGNESTLVGWHFTGGLYAIQMLGSHSTVLGGTGKENATTVYIGSESANSVFNGFHSVDATADGVIIAGDYAQLGMFSVDNPGGDGIQIESTATGTRIVSGRVTSAGGYGIRDAGTGTVVNFDWVDLTGNTSGEYLNDFTGQSDRDALGEPWTEGADILVNQNQLAIRSGAVARDTGATVGTAFRDTRFRGNVSIKTLWDGTNTGEGGPMIHLNPSDPFLGVGMVWNSFLSAWSLRYVGQDAAVDAQLLDTTPASRVNGTDATVELRSVGGKVAGYVDGTLVCGPITIASTLAGSKLHGLMVTDTSLAGTAVDVPSIKNWAIDSYTTPLSVSRATETVQGTATTAKTVGASNTLALAYPAGITAGELLVLVVVSQKTGGIGGTSGFTHPSAAYRSGSADVTGQQAWAYRFADGSESGSVTVTKSGTAGEMGAMMFRVSAPNTATPFPAPDFSNNASSTTIDAPAKTIVGPWRLGLWAGSALANQAITPPASWTEIAELGTAGATLNLSVAYRDWNTVHTAPFGASGETTGEQDGSIAAAAANVGGHTFVNPS